jgi:hypothetical protein
MTADERTVRERAILKRLRALRPQIEGGERKLEALYAERLSVFQDGRALDPPMVQRVMGEASGVSEAAVIHVLKRQERNAAKGA